MITGNLIKNDIGKVRLVKKFLFLPRTFNGKCKWLVTTYIIEQVQIIMSNHNEIYTYVIKWVEIGFNDP